MLPMPRPWYIAAIIWTAVVLMLTLSSGDAASPQPDLTPWYCIVCGPTGGADVLQNLLLLLPLGFALAAAGQRFAPAAAAVTLLPIAIELLQWTMHTGRDAALGDVLANATGGMLGWLMGRYRERLALPDHRVAAPLAFGAFVIQLLVTTALTEPMPTGPTPWRWQITPETERRPLYRGTIDSITFSGETMIIIPDGIASPVSWNTAGTPGFAVNFRWDRGESERLTPIIRLDDATGEPIVAVDRRGTDLGLSLRTTATKAGLRTPTVLIAVPADQQSGEALRVSLSIDSGRIIASTTGPGGSAVRSVPFGAQHGWTLINPFTPTHDLGATWHWWTIAWLFGWGMILGWTLCGATLPGRIGWAAAALSALMLLTTSSGTAVTPVELAGCGAGILLGVSPALLRRQPDADAATTSRHHRGR